MNVENDLAFVIICPNYNIGGLRQTVSSIKTNFPGMSHLCVTGDNLDKKDIKELSRCCPTYSGGNTITSLISTGVKKSPKKWCFTIVAGNFVWSSLFRKYFYFLNSDKDIIYSVADKYTWLFEDASINGILMNKAAIKEVGDMPDEESIVYSKLLWSIAAREKGYALKGLVGVKL